MAPRKRTTLTDTERRHLQEHYVTRYSMSQDDSTNKQRLQNISSAGTMWGRCKKLESNLTFGSQFSQRQKLSGRLNSFACFQQEVDINARYQRRDIHLVPVDYYGDIKYFFLHNFEDVDRLLI
jgi:hypothetical protein